MSWSRPLPEPIKLKDGRKIATLGQARAVMLALPERHQFRPFWQYAAELLIEAAEHNGDVGGAPGNFRTAVLKFKIVSFASSIPKLSLDSPRNSTRRALYRTHYMFGVHVRIQHRLAIAHSLHLEELM